MIIPYKVDVSLERRPIGNYLILLAMAGAFLFQGLLSREQVSQYGLRDQWSPVMLGGYMWLHMGALHIVGNMLFLWVFGNAVCAKVGNLIYVLLYLAAGVLGGAAHVLFDGRAAIGASGAVFGVMGAYLMLYPFNLIRCLFFFIFVKLIRVAGVWVIVWWVVLNLIGIFTGYMAKAYFTHIGGLLAGVAMAWMLMQLRVVERDCTRRAIFKSLKT